MQECVQMAFIFTRLKKSNGIMWKDARIIIKADVHKNLFKKSENLAYHCSLQGSLLQTAAVG